MDFNKYFKTGISFPRRLNAPNSKANAENTLLFERWFRKHFYAIFPLVMQEFGQNWETPRRSQIRSAVIA